MPGSGVLNLWGSPSKPRPSRPGRWPPRGQAQKPAPVARPPTLPGAEKSESASPAVPGPAKASQGLKPGQVRRAARFQHAACKTDGYLRQEGDALILKVGAQRIVVTPLADLALPPLLGPVHVNFWPRLDEEGTLGTWLLSRVEVLEATQDEELVVRVAGTLSGRDEDGLNVTITPKAENRSAQPFTVRLWGPHGLLRALPEDGTPLLLFARPKGRRLTVRRFYVVPEAR